MYSPVAYAAMVLKKKSLTCKLSLHGDEEQNT